MNILETDRIIFCKQNWIKILKKCLLYDTIFLHINYIFVYSKMLVICQMSDIRLALVPELGKGSVRSDSMVCLYCTLACCSWEKLVTQLQMPPLFS